MGKWERIPRGEIPSESLSTIYKLVGKAIENTNKDGKTTDEIFGEIYTRFRSEAIGYGANGDLKRFFAGKLKRINESPAGRKLNSIINELYAEQENNESSLMDLELCTTIMDNCVLDAKKISTKSEKIISNLEQIDQEFNGGI